jgi:hypothetical protein
MHCYQLLEALDKLPMSLNKLPMSLNKLQLLLNKLSPAFNKLPLALASGKAKEKKQGLSRI